MTEPAAPPDWPDHFVERRLMRPADLTGNPRNWRKHPARQRQALEESLDAVGWLDDLKVNLNTGRIFHGHLRRDTAQDREQLVPVSFYDLTEDQETRALLYLDAISGMIEVERQHLTALRDQAPMAPPALRLALDQLGPAIPLDPWAAWQGMPEFEQRDLTAYQQIRICFADAAAVNRFAALIGLPLTDKTRFCWYPVRPPRSNKGLWYAGPDESEAAS